jgi:hypothetical protein
VAADRYGLPIQTALDEIGANALLRASRPIPGQDNVRDSELRQSRARVPPTPRVTNPRHKVVYKVAANGVVDILAVVGSSLPSPLALER